MHDERTFDDALLFEMLSGDENAFRAIYRAVQPGFLRYLGVLVGAFDAEDVAAEAWAQALRDLHRFSGDADGFRGWLTTIGRNRAMDLLRARGRRPIVDVPTEDLLGLSGSHDTEGDALGLVATREALELIASLPTDQAEAVLLRAVVGLDSKTAGQVLGKRAGAVRTAAYRGLRNLRRRLDQGSDPVVGAGCDTAAAPRADEVT